MHSMLKTPLLLMCTVGAFLLTGCESDGNPTEIDRSRGELTLANVWPDADGNSWHFRARLRAVNPVAEGPLFDSPADLPAMPSLDEIQALLPAEFEAPEDLPEEPTYHLRFDGETAAENGTKGKRLDTQFDDGFLDGGKRAVRLVFKSQVLRGGIWSRTSDYIAFLDVIEGEPQYRILDADLQAGSEWSSELYPSTELGPVYHARILPGTLEKFPSYSAASSIRLFYVLDTGAISLRTPYETDPQYMRGVVYGFVDFEKNVGPVRFFESGIAWLDEGDSGETILFEPQTAVEGWLSAMEE